LKVTVEIRDQAQGLAGKGNAMRSVANANGMIKSEGYVLQTLLACRVHIKQFSKKKKKRKKRSHTVVVHMKWVEVDTEFSALRFSLARGAISDHAIMPLKIVKEQLSL